LLPVLTVYGFSREGDSYELLAERYGASALVAGFPRRQLVLELGGELLNGSGFENDTPDQAFETEDQANA
jgi:hypothetical protein